jgi:orotate phosphoribosyltransferase
MTAARTLTPEARATAKILFEIGAVNFNAEKPYIFTSGWASPVYVDCRKIVSYPKQRRELMKMAAEILKRDANGAQFDMVAGGETAGIPFGAWLSDVLDKPMVYVRKQPKGFGRMAQIEGDLKEGSKVLLVEDLASDGKSKIKFIDVLRKAGVTVEHAFVIFHYGIFPQSEKSMADIGVKLHGLCTWWDALAVAKEQNSFDAKTLAEVESFLNDPMRWSAAHGGATGEAASA